MDSFVNLRRNHNYYNDLQIVFIVVACVCVRVHTSTNKCIVIVSDIIQGATPHIPFPWFRAGLHRWSSSARTVRSRWFACCTLGTDQHGNRAWKAGSSSWTRLGGVFRPAWRARTSVELHSDSVRYKIGCESAGFPAPARAQYRHSGSTEAAVGGVGMWSGEDCRRSLVESRRYDISLY